MKIVTVACGEKYRHMIEPFVNSAYRAGYDPVVWTDMNIPGTYKVEFTYRGDKVRDMLTKCMLWADAVKEYGECLLMDVDMVIMGRIELPDADVVYTVDKRFSPQWDYVNGGFLYCRKHWFMDDLVAQIATTDMERAVKKPYMSVDQMAFQQMIGFTPGHMRYTYKGLDVVGVPCDVYNHYDDDKPLKPGCKVLHYKNRWQGGRMPRRDKMDIISGYLDAPLRGEDILVPKG